MRDTPWLRLRWSGLRPSSPATSGSHRFVTRTPGSVSPVSYWATDDDARAWKQVTEHREVQRLGRTRWYDRYLVEIARVDRVYGSTA